MRKKDRKKLDAFEIWVWRTILRVSWTERKTNRNLQTVRPNISLEVMTKMLKIRYFGHVVRAHQSLAKDICL
jgi:hypothetical protein